MVLIMLSLALEATSQTEHTLASLSIVPVRTCKWRCWSPLPGFGWRYSVVLVIISSTALLVTSTFYSGKHTIETRRGWETRTIIFDKIRVLYAIRFFSSKVVPLIDVELVYYFAFLLLCHFFFTFSISLKSSSSLVPSAPPTFSLTFCCRKHKMGGINTC